MSKIFFVPFTETDSNEYSEYVDLCLDINSNNIRNDYISSFPTN